MELHLVIEILNYVLNGRNTPTMFQGFIWHRRQVTQTLLNVRPRYWVGHFRKTNFLMRAQRWKHRRKGTPCGILIEPFPVGAEICRKK